MTKTSSARVVPRLALAALLGACGSDPATADGGPRDAGRDGGLADASSDAAVAATDGGSDGGAPRPSAEIVEGASCDAGPLSSTTCRALSVRCAGRDPIGVEVRVSQPEGASRGTLVVGTGGGGESFADAAPDTAAMLERLRGDGYRVVQRRWASPGWFAGETGPRAASCAYAALLGWIDETIADGDLCAMGLSGGSIELAYALSRWDGAERLEGAVLLGGPSMSALDRVCPSVAPSSWTETECPALAASYGVECSTLYCTLQGAAGVVDSSYADAPCASGGDRARLAADGVVAPGARYVYPSRVAFVVGADECGGSLLPFVDAVGSAASFTVVAGTPHDVWSTPAGRAATEAAVYATCNGP